MKPIIRNLLYLQMAAWFLTAALAGPGAAGHPVPFKGSVQAQESYEIDFPTMLVDTSGSGNATHLGHFTITWEFTVNLLTGAGVGSAHFIRGERRQYFYRVCGGRRSYEDPQC
jgi:hypothetical protein